MENIYKSSPDKQHLTHYIKYQLKNDISIRYHYTWQDNQEFENVYIIKDHQKSIKHIIPKELALRMIEDLSTKEPVEIIGRSVIKEGKRTYQKRVLKANSCKYIDDSILDKKHDKRISKKVWRQKGEFLYREVKGWNYTITFADKDKYTLVISDASKTVKHSKVDTYENISQKIKEYISSVDKPYMPSEKRLKSLR